MDRSTQGEVPSGIEPASFTRLLRWTAIAYAALAGYAWVSGLRGEPFDLFVRQDRQVILLFAAVLLGLSCLRPRQAAPVLFSPRWPLVTAMAVLVLLLAWAGTHAVMHDYPFTRDEQMAVFDTAIFRTGHLTAAIPAEWRAFAPSLAPLYALHFRGNAVWASAYLPGNAGLRAAFSLIMDPALFNPALIAAGALFLFAIARRLLPASGSAQAIVLLVYFTSAQVAVTAMTPFAMSAHLALNLLWLLLFLRGGLPGHAGAAATGFVATGLHQVIFHPLFAAPFLLHLWQQRAWRPLVFYCLVYLAAGLFWISYAGLIGGSVLPAGSTSGAAGGFIHDRLMPLLANRDPAALPLMIFNLVRFAAWQNLALVPLALLAVGLARKGHGLAQPLYFGILITIAAMFILLPFQSFGWGYRYLHGLVGNAALLAGYGWQRVERDARAHLLVLCGAAVTVFVTLPYLAWTARTIVSPSVEASRAIDALTADFVIVDTDDIGLARDQARNGPFLRNRPLRFASSALRTQDVQLLCRRGRLTFIGSAEMERFGIVPYERSADPSFPRLQQSVAGEGCVQAAFGVSGEGRL